MPLSCPHCGENRQDMITRWLEPESQIKEEAQVQRAGGKKYYCEQCGRTWVVQTLPLEPPSGPTR